MAPAGEEQQGDGCGSAARRGEGRGRAPRATPAAPAEIPSPLRPGQGLLRLRACVGWRVSPLSCLMRVKKLTGLFPTMISTALQVSLETERPRSHPGSILLLFPPASLCCHELVGAQPAA